jgi:hypothetical protein
MAIRGHKTRSVFDRYNIVNETDLKVAVKALATYYEQEKVTLSVTLAELIRQERLSQTPRLTQPTWRCYRKRGLTPGSPSR